jgi:hypothetical protein
MTGGDPLPFFAIFAHVLMFIKTWQAPPLLKMVKLKSMVNDLLAGRQFPIIFFTKSVGPKLACGLSTVPVVERVM